MRATALRNRLQGALAAHVLRRHGEDALPMRLSTRRIYILPTRSGVLFCVALLGMLFGGLNYGNSLALLLTFLLGALGTVAMFQCHRRLLGFEITSVVMPGAFAGDGISLVVAARVPEDGRDARDVRIRASTASGDGPWSSFALEGARDRAVARVAVPPAARGPWKFPRLRFEQRAPFGLFKAWSWVHVRGGGLVWPRPSGTRPLPSSAGDRRGTDLALAGHDEWAGLRPFRDGDSPRQVAWKAYARGAPLLVREYHDPRGRQRRLDFSQLPMPDAEERLAQLARWVLDAEHEGESWSLHLPGRQLPLASGAAHRRACLDALATHGFEVVQ